MGAVTAAGNASTQKPTRSVFGDRFIHFMTLTMSGSYATGGDTVAFGTALGFKLGLDQLMVEDFNVDATHVYRAIYDRTNGKIKVINLIGGAEVANAVDLSAVAFRAIGIGK